MLSTSPLSSSQFLGLRIATTPRPENFSSAGAPASPSSPTALRSPAVSAAYAPAAEPASYYAPPSPRRAPSSSLYQVLGVPACATGQEIKTAYRRLALEFHPDVAGACGGGGANPDNFMRIHAAYATLSDADKRAEYDRKLMIWPRGNGPATEWTPPTASTSPSFDTAGGSGRRPTYSGSSTYQRRSRLTWETDQCW